jgi:D-glycero-alpha-D-manno-heptose-7-phosphate kinase
MIITRTPFRISFFGGGTDYPVWYEKHGGAVLSTAIDKYCYITCRYFPPFFEFPLRVAWSKVELVKDVEEVEHPAVKGVMKFFNIKDGLEINHVADLPARSGLGASSSFTVGLIKAISALKKEKVSRYDLVQNAIHVERNIMKENVGSQDQVAAAFGGFNKIVFKPDNKIEVIPVNLGSDVLNGLRGRLLLFFTGLSRNASELAGEQIKKTPEKEKELRAIYGMVDEGINLLKKGDLDRFGQLLHESWLLKRGLTHLISTPLVDEIYESARSAGALGGKLLGAGGGGFILFYAKPEDHEKIKMKLKNFLHVPFHFEQNGSTIIYNENDTQHYENITKSI